MDDIVYELNIRFFNSSVPLAMINSSNIDQIPKVFGIVVANDDDLNTIGYGKKIEGGVFVDAQNGMGYMYPESSNLIDKAINHLNDVISSRTSRD